MPYRSTDSILIAVCMAVLASAAVLLCAPTKHQRSLDPATGWDPAVIDGGYVFGDYATFRDYVRSSTIIASGHLKQTPNGANLSAGVVLIDRVHRGHAAGEVALLYSGGVIEAKPGERVIVLLRLQGGKLMLNSFCGASGLYRYSDRLAALLQSTLASDEISVPHRGAIESNSGAGLQTDAVEVHGKQQAAIRIFERQGATAYIEDSKSKREIVLVVDESPSDADMLRLRDIPALVELHFGEQASRRTGPTNEQLVYLKRLPQLRQLVMSHRHVTDDGLSHLAALKNLEHLDVSYCNVTYEGLAQLVSELPKLKWLYIDENWEVSLEQVQMLERLRPGCTVIR